MKTLLAAAVLAGGLILSPAANAVPGTCEHRGLGHVDQHGGQLADDAYHLSRGERVTCSAEGSEPNKDTSGNDRHWPGHDKHRWWRND